MSKVLIRFPKFDKSTWNDFLNDIGKAGVDEIRNKITLYHLGRESKGVKYDVNYKVDSSKVKFSIGITTSAEKKKEDQEEEINLAQSVPMTIGGQLYVRPASPLGVQTGITFAMYLDMAKTSLLKEIPQIFKQNFSV